MEHALVLDNESHGMGTGCSRCGATDKAVLALPCTAVSDGEIYAAKSHQTPCEAFIPGADPERCLVCRFTISSH